MALLELHQQIIDKLYNLYREQGFIREDEALLTMSENNTTLQDIDRIMDKLLSLGVMFADEATETDEDNAQTDYEAVFIAVTEIAPQMSSFVDYVREIRPPQRNEWQQLLPQSKNGNQYATERLFDMYLRVVVKIALSYNRNSKVDIEDAIQDGAIGLLRSIEQYDSSKHGNFGSYLPWWVRQHIDRAIADNARTIRIPVHLLETLKQYQDAEYKLEQESGRSPTSAELAAKLEIDIHDAEKYRNYLVEPISIETFAVIGYDGYVEYDILDEDSVSPLDYVADQVLKDLIEKALKTLNPREASVLRLRYGIDDGQERTLEEVGTVFNVTRERVRQIEAKALRKLKHPTRSKKLEDFYD
jgi:RNA polymerase primary sigma factor